MELLKTIYTQLTELGVISFVSRGGSHSKVKNVNGRNVSVDVLSVNGDIVDIAISSYWLHESGDMMADPDIQIQYSTESQEARIRAFQADGVPNVGTIYVVLFEDGVEHNLIYKQGLHQYLSDWLNSLINNESKF